MKPLFYLLWFIILFYSACKTPVKEKPAEVEQRDTTITTTNAYTELFLDSLSLERYIQFRALDDSTANQFRSFYNARNYQYAWFFKDGPAEQAFHFLNQQADFIAYSRDTTLQNPVLQQLFDTLENGNKLVTLTDSSRLQAELSLTAQFFKYAAQAYQGNSELNASALKWFIPRKKVNLVAALDSLISNKSGQSDYEPLNPYYTRLKSKLLAYYEIEKKQGWQKIITDKKKLQEGDTANAIRQIKKRLQVTGDYDLQDSSNLFTDSLAKSIRVFQRLNGMKEDGVAGPAVITAMNIPVEERIKQMLINLERMRWVPAKIEGDYLLVNIPEFALHIFEDAVPIYKMNVVVGTNQNSTVIFSGNLQYIVFSPYWNVPPGILKNEVLPGMKKNPNYLARHNMEINGYTGGLPNVRQKPGPNNSLGKVKFLFPNSYSIYMHDTPAKSLFGETKRAFSHGCIRLREPKKLAEFLLRDDSTWTSKAIDAAMNSGKEKHITLKKPVPVFIGYFTAWVDSKGDLNFRDDVYGHDAKIKSKMFGQ